MSHEEKKPARNILPDLIIPALATAFAIYYLTTITEVPWISQASAVFVSCLLFIAILAYAIRTAGRIRRREETIRFGGVIHDLPTQLKRIALLALTIGYVVLLEPLGFTLATFLFLLFGIILLSSPGNWKNAVKVALVCAVLGYVIFIYFFGTRFPEGFIETALEELLKSGA